MGTRTYSRRAADGSRKPTALGIRTGRYRGTGEPAYASTSIPQGWTGSDGDVGIYKDVGDMRISIVPSGFESRGGRAYYALQISNPRDDEQSPYSLVLSRNTESSWEDLQNEAKELTDLLEETMTYNDSMGFSVSDDGTLTIVDNDNNTQMTITRNGEWESEATEYDPAYGVTYGAGGKTGSSENPLTALRNALMDFGMRSEEAYLRRAGIAEPRTLLTRTPATYRPLTPIQRTLPQPTLRSL